MFSRLALIAAIAFTGITMSGYANAAGDIGKGKTVFNKCRACHSIKPEKNGVGPTMFGVIGRKAGSVAGFKRYKGLKTADWVWDEETLSNYLADPRKFTKSRTGKNSSMVLKLKKERDRNNVIEYLKTIK